jgi:hypothetical protein
MMLTKLMFYLSPKLLLMVNESMELMRDENGSDVNGVMNECEYGMMIV